MSIDARVRCVIENEDGTGKLVLEDRPATPGQNAGIAGQSALHFDSAPHEVTCLNGRDIWGSADTIMCGETKIAERIGYTKIRFVTDFKGMKFN